MDVEERRINGGGGLGSVRSILQVKTCLNKPPFKKLLKKSLTPAELDRTQALNWRVKQAPSQSDIIWENM